MHARQAIPPDLDRLAGLQAEVVTREQALGLQLSARSLQRLVDEGRWSRISPGVFHTTPGPVSWRSLAWAGVLVGGDDSRLGGAAAGHAHGIVEDPPEVIGVLIPGGRAHPTVPGPWTFSREARGFRSPKTVDDPPRTAVEDTVLDLVHRADDVETIVEIVTRAVQSRLTTAKKLRRAADGRRTLRHRKPLLGLLADVGAGANSPLELDYLRNVERAHGLPVGERQRRRRQTEVDVLYEQYATLVELDGKAGHTGAGKFRDMRRDNSATVDGLSTLRYGWSAVHDEPCVVAVEVAEVLINRGWRGLLERCGRCRLVHSV